MAGSRLAWIVIAAVVGLLAAGFGIYFAVSAGDSNGKPAGTALATATTPAATETPTPALPPPTEPPTATTAPTTEPPPTEPGPTPLPSPPPRPENLTPAEGATLAGGQWYMFGDCIVFYLPAGWNFNLHGAVIDPGGQLSLGFEEPVSGSSLVFDVANLELGQRTVMDPALDAAFDQIAATIATEC